MYEINLKMSYKSGATVQDKCEANTLGQLTQSLLDLG